MRSAQKSTSHKFWWRLPLNLITILTLLANSLFPVGLILPSRPEVVQAAESAITWSDDFENTSLNEWELSSIGPLNTISSDLAARNGQRVLKLTSDGIGGPIATKTFSSPQQGTLSIWFYDTNPNAVGGTAIMVFNEAENQVVMLGLNPGYPTSYYYRATFNPGGVGISSNISRQNSWVKFEIVVTSSGSYGRINDISLASLATNPNLTSFTKIRIASPWGSAGTYLWDDLKLQGANSWSDDFESGALSGWELQGINNTNTITSDSAARSGQRVLKLTSDGKGAPFATKTFSSPQQGTLSIWLYDANPNTVGGTALIALNEAENQVVMLGLNPSYPNSYYYRAAVNDPSLGKSSNISRTQGWHKFEIAAGPGGAYGKIDGVSLTTLPVSGQATSVNPNLTGISKIRIAVPWANAGTYIWDDLKLQVPQTITLPWVNDFEGDDALADWEISASAGNTVAVSSPPGNVGIRNGGSGSRALTLSLGGGGASLYLTRHFDVPQQGVLSIWFYDPGSGGAAVMALNEAEDQIVLLGTITSNRTFYYYRAAANNPVLGKSSSVYRTQGWHKFEIAVTPKGSYGKIDGAALSFLPDEQNGQATAVNTNLTAFSKIRIAVPWGDAGSYFWDDLRLDPLPAIPQDIVSREKYFLEKYLETPMPVRPGIDHTCTEMRPKAIRAAIEAYLNRNIDEAKALILELAETYNSQEKIDQYYAGCPFVEAVPWRPWFTLAEIDDNGAQKPGASWGSSFVVSSLGLAAWLLWPQLDQATQNKVREALFAQAEEFLKFQPRVGFDPGTVDWTPEQAEQAGLDPDLRGMDGNTPVEESAAMADALLLLARMFPQDERAPVFEAQGKKFAFHSLTKQGDNRRPVESYAGWTSQTVNQRYLVWEHAIYSQLNYGVVGGVGMLGSAARYYLRSGSDIPQDNTLTHNIVPVFEAHNAYLSPKNYRINFMRTTLPSDAAAGITIDALGGKDDWSTDGTYYNSAFAYYGKLTGNTNPLRQLEEYELYVTRDFLGFPQGAEASYIACRRQGGDTPVRCKGAPDFYYADEGKDLINSVIAWSHLVAATIFDESLTLPSTISTSAGTTPNCSSVYLKTPGTSQGRVEVFKRKLWGSPSPIWECDNTQIPRGRQGPSLKITSFSPVTNGEAYSRLIPVRAGKDYILSYWVKTADLEGVNVGRVAVSGYNQSAQEANEINENRIQTQQVADLLNSGDPLAGTWDWQERSFLFTPPPGTAYVRVRAGLSQAQGSVWFADLELKEATGFNFFLNSITPREGQILENTPFGLSVVTTLDGSRPWASQGVYLRVFEQSQGICLRVGESQTSCNNNSNLLRNTWQGRQDFTVNFPGLGRGIYTLTVQTIVRRQFLIFSWDDVRKSTTFNFGVPLLPSALPQNLLSNPGFETGNVSPWVGEKASLTLIDGNSSPADIRSGRWAARVTLESQTPFYSIDNFPGEVPNPRVGETYYGTVWVKGAGNSLGKGVRLVIREHDNATPQYRRLESPGSLVPLTDSWQQLSVSHTITNTGMTNLDILVTQEGALGGESFLVDDFFLSRVSSQNLLSNPGFESGQTSPWGSWQGILARSNDKHSGSWASLVSYDYQPNRPGFLPGAYSIDNWPGEVDNPQIGQVYYATAWVKGVGSSVGKPVKLSIREHDFVRVNDVPGEFVTLENGWRQISAYYKVTNIGMTKLDVYVLQVDAAVGDTFLTDDIALYRF